RFLCVMPPTAEDELSGLNFNFQYYSELSLGFCPPRSCPVWDTFRHFGISLAPISESVQARLHDSGTIMSQLSSVKGQQAFLDGRIVKFGSIRSLHRYWIWSRPWRHFGLDLVPHISGLGWSILRGWLLLDCGPTEN